MNKEQIFNSIKSLAKSQGSYGRILSVIEENPNLLDELENQKFNDILDLVMFFEGC